MDTGDKEKPMARHTCMDIDPRGCVACIELPCDNREAHGKHYWKPDSRSERNLWCPGSALVGTNDNEEKPVADRDPSKTFANPFIACTTCGVRVYWFDGANDPCGHRGADKTVTTVSVGKKVSWNEHTDAWQSLCPSWGPVSGCQCPPGTHGTPSEEGRDPQGEPDPADECMSSDIDNCAVHGSFPSQQGRYVPVEEDR